MKQEITMEELEQAMKLVKQENTCEKCKTERNIVVLGFGNEYGPLLFCKCEAEELCETPYVKSLAKQIKYFTKNGQSRITR